MTTTALPRTALLRHAAATLRRLLRTTTPGPWDHDTEFAGVDFVYATADGTPRHDHIARMHSTGGHSHNRADNARWMATMDPEVGQALAQLLTTLAGIDPVAPDPSTVAAAYADSNALADIITSADRRVRRRRPLDDLITSADRDE